MKWLLSLFPQFRALEAELHTSHLLSSDLRSQLHDATTQSLILQDRIDSALSDRAKLWETMQQAIQDMKTSYQMHVNEQWQKQYGVAPYPDSPQLPTSMNARPVNDPVVPRTSLPSEIVRRQSKAFIEKWFNPDTQ